MTVVGISMVKDEADVVGFTVEHMLHQCDYVLVADNMSTDATPDILDNLVTKYDNLLVVPDHEPAYFQSAKMTSLAHQAHKYFGAEWIVPFDADEWWGTTSTDTPLRTRLQSAPDHRLFRTLAASLYDHVPTAADPWADSPIHRMVYRTKLPLPLPKTIGRWAEDMVIEQGNHAILYGGKPCPGTAVLTCHHFPVRSFSQFVRKARNGAAAYAAAGPRLDPSSGAHWRSWGKMSDDELLHIYQTYYFRSGANPLYDVYVDGALLPRLMYDPIVISRTTK